MSPSSLEPTGEQLIAGAPPRVEVRVHERIDEIPADQWNRLIQDNNPILRYEFLHAMERHGCVGEGFGWLPRHLGIYGPGGLLGAMPLYEKYNSYGEFVFDQAWADAYSRSGLAYYPKLVSAIPYTPAMGQRLLCLEKDEDWMQPLLLQVVLELIPQLGASGFHCLFPLPEEHRLMSARLLSRYDCQFHWHNPGYRDFDEFLDRLTAKKRKNIRQERRRVRDSGVRLRRLSGSEATDNDWRNFSRFYNRTFEQKWGIPTFNFDFFREVAARLPDRIVLVLADDRAGHCVAGALMYCSDSTLYGRHWGCLRWMDALHFEACYYQGIEFCIERGLRRFEPGAQGEHKMARGFVPTLTRSAHWIEDERFRQPIAAYVRREQEAIMDYITGLEAASPYRQEFRP